MYLDASEISCGIRQIVDVHYANLRSFKNLFTLDSDQIKQNTWDSIYKNYIYIWSDNSSGNGKLVEKWIKKYKLGTVKSTPWQSNPNTGRNIKMWTWRYNGHIPKEWKKELKEIDIYDEEF